MLLECARIQAKAGHREIENYRRLLQADWSRDTLDDVLALLWVLISDSLAPSAFGWQKVLEGNSARASRRDLDGTILERLRELADVLREDPLPPMPARFSSNRVTRPSA